MAGTLKVNAVQLGDSATATDNFVLQTNVDGSGKLARGTLGATTQDILTVASTGILTANQGISYTPASDPATTVQAQLSNLFRTNVVGTSSQGYDYLYRLINSSIDGTDGTAGKVDGLRVVQYFGGAGAKGGRHGIESFCILQTATSTTNPDRNYVGGAFTGSAEANDSGTAPSPKGAVFGLGAVGSLTASATYFSNVTAAEFNTSILTGGSASIKTGIQICGMPGDQVKGTDLDAMISMGNQGGAKWTDGICFNSLHGGYPMDPTLGTLIRTRGTATTKALIDVTSYTFTTWLINANNFSVNNLGAMEVGQIGTSNTPYLNFHSSASATAYDVRLIATGGTGANGAGNLTINAATIGSTATAFSLASTQVVGTRITGWGLATNGGRSAFNASTATLAQTAAAVAQLIADMTTHGLIGA
jgi:hypothetical protein